MLLTRGGQAWKRRGSFRVTSVGWETPPPLPPTLCARESRAENTAMGVDFLKAERNTPGGDGEGREKYPWIVSENPILTSITGVEAWRGVAIVVDGESKILG